MKMKGMFANKKPSSEMLKARKPVSGKEKVKASKDPNAPKRPPTAFFVFMEEFRKNFKENFPDNKSVSAVVKAGGEKWRSLSDSDKAPYTKKALEKKAEYGKAVQAYKNGHKNIMEEESDKSSSEVHNDNEQEASS